MNAYELIGRKLQKAREEAGLSQDELARKIGCTQSSLSNYELGKRRLYFADLQRIGEVLGKPITYFLEQAEDEVPIKDEQNITVKELYMTEIIDAALELTPVQRRSVLDFILWQRKRSDNK